MSKFAKIIEFGGRQFLFYLMPDTEDPKPGKAEIHQIAHLHDGICADMVIHGIEWKSAERFVAGAGADEVAKLIKALEGVVGN